MIGRRCLNCADRPLIDLRDWAAHQRKHKAVRDKAYRAKRPGYDGRPWKRLSRNFLAANPYCDRCGEPAVHAHHTGGQSPRQPGGMDWQQLEPICSSCHGKIHAGVLPKRPPTRNTAGHVSPDPPGIV